MVPQYNGKVNRLIDTDIEVTVEHEVMSDPNTDPKQSMFNNIELKRHDSVTCLYVKTIRII